MDGIGDPSAGARDALLVLLSDYEPADAKERADLEVMRQSARVLARPFSPEQDGAHFTGSAVVVDPEGKRVCFIHHRKLGRWLQPGGHAEPLDEGELEKTALREAQEETGLAVYLHPTAPRPFDLDVHAIPAKGEKPGHLHLDVRYLLVAEDPEALKAQEAETLGARWFSFAEALEVADEEPLRRMLLKALHVCEGTPGLPS
jgi:8-oxo-dGTP pyrophosphatase MutT (NUDIX family)